MIIPNAGKDEGKLNHSYVYMGMQNGMSTLKNSLASTLKPNHTCHATQCCTLVFVSEKWKIFTQKLYTNIHSSFKSSQMETTQMFFKQTTVHLSCGILLCNKGMSYDTCHKLDELPGNYAMWKIVSLEVFNTAWLHLHSILEMSVLRKLRTD